MEIVDCVDINPNDANLNYLYQDDQGFNCFKIARASQLIDNSDKLESKNMTVQQIKFQVFILYVETLGRMQSQEFLIK